MSLIRCVSFLTFSRFCFSSAKSSHPKKAGGTTKPTSTSSAPRPRSKEAGAAAQSEGSDTTRSRKSDAPTSSSVAQKAPIETPNQPGDVKSLPPSSDSKPASSKASGSETEGAQASSSSPPNTSSQKGLAPEPTVQSPRVNAATEEGEADSRSGREGAAEEDKTGETESAVQNSPRYLPTVRCGESFLLYVVT